MYSIIRMNSNNNNNIASIYKIVDACMSVSAVHVSNTYIWNGNTLTIEQLCKKIHGEEKGFYSKRNNVEFNKHFTHSELLMISWISNKKQYFFHFFFLLHSQFIILWNSGHGYSFSVANIQIISISVKYTKYERILRRRESNNQSRITQMITFSNDIYTQIHYQKYKWKCVEWKACAHHTNTYKILSSDDIVIHIQRHFSIQNDGKKKELY